MNQIDLTEILKDCPKGTKLFSLIEGNVLFDRINDNNYEYPILVRDEYQCIKSFTKEGLLKRGYPDAECILFPSSKMRDWSTFFKRGDVVRKFAEYGIFDKWVDDTYTKFITSISYCYIDDTWNNKREWYMQDCKRVFDNNKFIKDAESHFKGVYNPITLQIESKCQFKPFDKVLVRNYDTDEWLPGFFYRFDKDWNYPYHIMNLHHLTDCAYLYCIPYEGNEHLLGTTNLYIEKDNE